jgi:flagellar hook-associated protein 1 FlgK
MASIGFSTGLRALLSAQYVLETVGHNIANANTEGYSRQRVSLESSLPVSLRGVLIGTGVNATSVRRSMDALLAQRLLGRVSVSGSLSSMYSGMSEVEASFSDLEGNGLGDDIEGFFASLSDLANAPEDAILRTGVVQSALSMTSHFNQLAGNLSGLIRDTDQEITSRVDTANDLAAQVAQLNLRIGESEAAGLAANDLRDHRDVILSELSELLEIRTRESSNGFVDVLVDGKAFVSGSRVKELSVVHTTDNEIRLQLEGSRGTIEISGGTLGGLTEMSRSFIPELRSELDRLARNLVLTVNRVHSTAIPSTGAFTSLTGEHAVLDMDSDGQRLDELLSNSGLPFDVSTGELHVNVVEESTGVVSKHRIDILETHTTVGDLLSDLNAIPHLSADLDAFGRIRLLSASGYGFDFSTRLPQNPDPAGTFGSGRASLGTAQGPFSLADGDTLDLTVDPSGASIALQIGFSTSDFAEISQATADEIAAVINADPGAQAAGIVATAVDGHLFLQSTGTGAGVEYRLDGGNAATALGWTGQIGSTISGHDNAVGVTLGGVYEGAGSELYTFRPNMDGTVGTTAGLVVDVLDSTGQLVASLDVGSSYQPGTELEVAQGITVKFGLGELSATQGDMFSIDLVADSDTTDVLVALGVNSIFVGNDATSIALRSDLEADPSLLATSLNGSAGDSSGILRLLDVEAQSLQELGNATLGQHYGELVGGLGFQISSTLDAIVSNGALVSSLEARQQQIAGVNVDEEMVDLMQYEQAYAAAAQYITVVNQIHDELLAII